MINAPVDLIQSVIENYLSPNFRLKISGSNGSTGWKAEELEFNSGISPIVLGILAADGKSAARFGLMGKTFDC